MPPVHLSKLRLFSWLSLRLALQDLKQFFMDGISAEIITPDELGRLLDIFNLEDE